LLLAPLTALILAQSPWTTLVPLAALALVAFEARRAATRVVRWLDDGEDFERETPEWRAALAFAAFQGSQVLAARLISSWTTDVGIVMGSSYAVSGVVLVGLTAYGRKDLAPIRLWPQNPAYLAVAVAAGVGTSTLGRFIVQRFMTLDSHGPDLELSHRGGLAFILTAGTLAPVVEELFFRGWLQHVIAQDLDARRKWLAPVIAALAFASVHPPASFPAVFSLGLVVGALYARTNSLAPCVAAHAAHNWVATLWHWSP
jgi:membrane protease YdiL (CAAX protease family)